MLAEIIRGAARQMLTTFNRPTEDRASPAYRQWAEFWGIGSTASGVAVNESSALTYSAVWAATCFYASALATVPLILYREMRNGDRDRATDHPLYPMLKDRPNDEQSNVDFWSMQGPCLVNRGNCYAEREYTYSGKVYGLWPIHAANVNPYRDGPGGPIRYEVTEDNGSKRYVDASDMWHVRGWISDDGISGKGVIRQARESIGLGMATEKFGAEFFGNFARPGVVLSGFPSQMKDDGVENVRRGWKKMHSDGNKLGVAILRGDIKVTTLDVSADDAQFIESRQFGINEIARWYNLPPHVLADLTRSTFSNIEQQDLNVLKYSLDPWFVRVEKSIKCQLLWPAVDVYSEYLRDAFLRTDTVARTEALYKQFMHGTLTLNEWRTKENRPKIPGEIGDTHFIPNNLVPADRAMQTPAEPAPAGQGKGVGGSRTQSKAIDAALVVAAEALHRMKRMQMNEVRRAAKDPRAYTHRLEQWIDGHVNTMADALHASQDLVEALTEAEVTDEPAAYCRWLRSAVLQSAEVPSDQLEQSAELLCKSIEEKPILFGQYEVK